MELASGFEQRFASIERRPVATGSSTLLRFVLRESQPPEAAGVCGRPRVDRPPAYADRVVLSTLPAMVTLRSTTFFTLKV